MSIIDILKEEYLYEDNTSDNQEPEVEEPNDNLVPVNRIFIIKLFNHLDKLFPSYGTFDSDILNEIRNYMDESDNNAVRKVKEKIHSMFITEKKKFFDNFQKRMGKLRIPKKKE